MADFPNIPIEVSAKSVELVASRPLIVYPTAPKGTDVGKEGQFWYAENTNELFIYTSNKNWENVNSVDLSEYVKNTFTIAGLPLTEDITDKELYVALGVSPTIQSDEPPHNTTGRAGQIYIQEFEDGSTKLYIQSRSGGGQRWLDITDGITDNVKKTLQIAGISLSADILAEDLISALGTPKVVVKDVDPTPNNGDENTFWINKTKNILYYCYSRSLSGYNWIKISGGNGESVDLSNYVPITRTIADIDLTDDITAEELQEKLSVYPIVELSRKPKKDTEELELVGKVGQIGVYRPEQNNAVYFYRCLSVTKHPVYGGKFIYEWEYLGTNSNCEYIPYNLGNINYPAGAEIGGNMVYSDSSKKSLYIRPFKNLPLVRIPIETDIVTAIDENVTDDQLPSAKLLYNTVGNIETTLDSVIAIQENLIGGATE